MGKLFSFGQIFSLMCGLFQSVIFGQIFGDLGATSVDLGAIAALSSLCLMFSVLFFGYLIDNFSSTKIYKISQVLLFFSNFLCIPIFYYSNHLSSWALYQMFYYFMLGSEMTARPQFIFNYLTKTNKHSSAKIVSYDILLGSIAKIFGFLLGATLSQKINILIPFFMNAFSYLFMFCIIYFLRVKENVNFKKNKEADNISFLSLFKQVYTNKNFLLLLSIESLFGFCFYSLNTQAYLFANELKSTVHFSWFLVMASVANLLINIFYKHKAKIKKSFIFCYFLSLTGLIILFFSSNMIMGIIGVMFASSSLSLISITTRSNLHELTPQNKGRIFSVFMINMYLFSSCGAIVYGLLISSFGFSNAFACLFVILSLIGFFIYKNID